MAYISQEDKKKLAPEIKKVLKKYGVKGSIAIDNHSTLVVNIKEGNLDFCGSFFRSSLNEFERGRRHEEPSKPTYIQVNTYYSAERAREIGDEEIANFYEELVEAMKGSKWFDRSDIMTDYFHTAYYLSINVGKWNKEYKLIA